MRSSANETSRSAASMRCRSSRAIPKLYHSLLGQSDLRSRKQLSLPRLTHHLAHRGIVPGSLTWTSVHTNDSSRFDLVHGGEKSCPSPSRFPFANVSPTFPIHAENTCACTTFGTSLPLLSWP